MNRPSEIDMLERIVSSLAEHFDCVQIIASKVDPDGSTESFHQGSGNWYARKALCEEFVEMDQADVIAKAISKEANSE